jgi:hypothetical protein
MVLLNMGSRQGELAGSVFLGASGSVEQRQTGQFCLNQSLNIYVSKPSVSGVRSSVCIGNDKLSFHYTRLRAKTFDALLRLKDSKFRAAHSIMADSSLAHCCLFLESP